MVLKKSFRVWRKYRPRSVLLETKEIPEEALLLESDAIATLCELATNTNTDHLAQSGSWCLCIPESVSYRGALAGLPR